MDIDEPLALLGHLTPAQFMRRHWQKKPLLIRQAVVQTTALINRTALCRLAACGEVESRLITQHNGVQRGAQQKATAAQWKMQSGPFASRALPAPSQPGWTLLVQGVNLHNAAVHALMQQFRFIPDARLDDVMVSFATPGGGVGPHFDSYDVFLLQTSGRRRWRISQQQELRLQPGAPLKILQNFVPDAEFVLEAGDMLYLPPRYAHDGVAEPVEAGKAQNTDCITCSIGFRAPAKQELAAELLHRLADFNFDDSDSDSDSDAGDEARNSRHAKIPARLYKDPRQAATATPAAVPPALLAFAQNAVNDTLKKPLALACLLGEYLTQPKASVWFEPPASAASWDTSCGLRLDSRTRMMYDEHHVFINGESYRARGRDAALMRQLADHRALAPQALRRASAAAVSLLEDWHSAGWLDMPA